MIHRVLFACVSLFAVCAVTGCSHGQVKAQPAPAAAAPAPAPASAPVLAPGTCVTDADCPGGRCKQGECR